MLWSWRQSITSESFPESLTMSRSRQQFMYCWTKALDSGQFLYTWKDASSMMLSPALGPPRELRMDFLVHFFTR
ncbi:hypothetical protein FR483_n473L [Paramecium bursaria Chlorella virus FR483]|uniref:Uncharacterized protein n473L n=1 Tax=Paramecium bursaria Chlorella virus FR483 TaxID=399781 RepID=A7J7H7_PBCVF|nr:hypothetical protein FR483_n473L [Paramecium bursaria Chlorella virus FR483]ABT15758.1 hypothetical protein FR483_n473L [Paramecium bursaria Chlorella virus FR483]